MPWRDDDATTRRVAFAAMAHTRRRWSLGRLAPYEQHGPLAVLLVALTVATGVVDAVSYIALGHVFVANMTGNVVLLGFALAGAPALSVPASLVAIAAFLLGAGGGGRLARRIVHRGALLRAGTGAGALLLGVAFVCALIASNPIEGAWRYVLIVPMAMALGVQNAVARRLAVPDLTTTVLTLTLTGLAADSRLADGSGGASARRILAVVAMFGGALAGGLLTVQASPAAALALAGALVAGVALGAHRVARSTEGWATGSTPTR
jgi:uncharacterized membrane protein YoaK (UPF0700 family)